MTRTTTLWSLLLLSAALALGSCTKDATEQATGPEPEAKAASKLVFSSENAVRGELLVCFGEEAVAGIESSVMQVTRSGGVATRSGIADFDAVLGSIGVKALQRLFPVDERNEERTRAAGLHRWYVVEFDAAADLDKAALDMARIAEVSKVEFNQQLMHVHEGRVIPLAETGAAPQTRAAVGFNDPHLGKQWHYINTGDKSIYSKIKAGADVNCDEAWKLCTGDPRVIVAVVDNCVQWDHPDLAANMWTNTAELNGSEGRDDDSNGYADDIHGFNFVDNTTLTISTKGDAPDHGTHVAGTVAAVNNNGTGVAGIAGGSGKNDGVKIMSCQIFHDKDGGDVATSAKAIKYAADNGAAIIQCSYGYPAGSVTSDAAYSSGASAEKQAIDYFIAKQNCAAVSGGLAIFAAGNDMTGMSSYPGAYRDYISVTAMSCDYTPAYYTNYGPGCNIAAPGGDAYQSYLENINTGASEVLSTVNGGKYGYMQGTSMACPHVSGVAALGLSYALQLGKTFTQNEFTTLLLTIGKRHQPILHRNETVFHRQGQPGDARPVAVQKGNGHGLHRRLPGADERPRHHLHPDSRRQPVHAEPATVPRRRKSRPEDYGNLHFGRRHEPAGHFGEPDHIRQPDHPQVHQTRFGGGPDQAARRKRQQQRNERHADHEGIRLHRT